MKQTVVERTTTSTTSARHHCVALRRLALIGGTTTFADCLVALRCLTDPLHLVHGPAIAAYEQAFAKQVGIPVDLDAALDLARRHGLDLIEDCVHALGATYNGRQVGSFGRAAFFNVWCELERT